MTRVRGMKTFALLYNSFLWATAAAVALFQITWLEMRVNMGWILFGLWAILSLCAHLRGLRPGRSGTTASLAGAIGCCALLLGWERLFAVPAFILREGLGIDRTPVDAINVVLAALLASGWSVIAIGTKEKA